MGPDKSRNTPDGAEGFTSVISSPTVFMFAVVFILIVAGCFIDAVPALLIFAPILIPTATQYGISLIHFGVVMVVTLCIGLVTPPVGINLFVASSVGGQLYIKSYRICRYLLPQL